MAQRAELWTSFPERYSASCNSLRIKSYVFFSVERIKRGNGVVIPYLQFLEPLRGSHKLLKFASGIVRQMWKIEMCAEREYKKN